MPSIRSTVAPTTLSLFLALLRSTSVAALSTQPSEGCFSSPGGLVFQGSYMYQTWSTCQSSCTNLQQPVAGLTKGSDCWCGSSIPSSGSQVPDTQCSSVCDGFGSDSCGGPNAWLIMLTGVSSAVSTDGGNSSPSPSSAAVSTSVQTVVSSITPSSSAPASHSTTATPQYVTVNGVTQIVTLAPSSTSTTDPSSTPQSSSGTSTGTKAGIAVGVVIGVLGLAAIVIGLVLFLRRRRNAEASRHSRITSVGAFAGSGSAPAGSINGASDSRLDHSMVERRTSRDSIFADNQDYSRRILRVTNTAE